MASIYVNEIDVGEHKHMLKLSIGICAFNEEGNIRNLLLALSKQARANFDLVEIIVNSDGSQDETVSESNAAVVREVAVLDNPDRKGKSFRQQQIFNCYSGDVLLMLDADILPKDTNFLSQVLAPFMNSPAVGLVSCPLEPLPANTLVGNILNFSVQLKEELLRENNHADNIYACHGPVRAFRRALTVLHEKDIVVSEDAYSYLLCKSKGFQFAYVTGTFVWFRSPQTLADHFTQSTRFTKGQEGLATIFGTDIVRHAHAIPFSVQLRVLLRNFFKHPVHFIEYLTIFFVSKFWAWRTTGQGTVWDIAKSSKKL